MAAYTPAVSLPSWSNFSKARSWSDRSGVGAVAISLRSRSRVSTSHRSVSNRFPRASTSSGRLRPRTSIVVSPSGHPAIACARLTEFDEVRRIEFAWVQEQGLFFAQVVGVRPGAAPTVFEREEVLLEPLVAQFARIEEVVPFVRQPVVARPFELVRCPLFVAGLRAEVFDIAVADMGNDGLAEGALVVLGVAEGVLDLLGGVDGVVKVEGSGTALEIVGR